MEQDEPVEHEDIKRRFRELAPDARLRVVAALGHNLTVAARDAYEFQAPGVREPQRLRAINEIQHQVFGYIISLTSVDKWRYSEDDLISTVLDFGDERVRAQSLWALKDALEHAVS